MTEHHKLNVSPLLDGESFPPHSIPSIEQLQDDQGWTLLGTLPSAADISTPIRVNGDEFILATTLEHSRVEEQQYAGIWRYSVSNNDWKWIVKYDKDKIGGLSSVNITFNPNTYNVFIYSFASRLIVINLLSGKHTIHENDKLNFRHTYHRSWSVNKLNHVPLMVYADGFVHFIGNSTLDNVSNDVEHIIWDCLTHEVNVVHTFKKENLEMIGWKLVYLSNKKQLILFGEESKEIYVCTINIFTNYNTNTNTSNKCINNMFEWSKKEIKMPKMLSHFQCIATENEKYLIILYGLDKNNWYSKDIFILNLDTMQVIKSNASVPTSIASKGYYWNPIAVSVDKGQDKNKMDLLISGLLKKWNININISMNWYLTGPMIPIDVVSIISKMYPKEYIHTLRSSKLRVKDTYHFEISLTDILKQATPHTLTDKNKKRNTSTSVAVPAVVSPLPAVNNSNSVQTTPAPVNVKNSNVLGVDSNLSQKSNLNRCVVM